MTSAGLEVISGLVLCRVGTDRLAVRAHEVSAFEAPDAASPYAGAGFEPRAAPPPDARLLRAPQGGLIVDAVEVHAEPSPLLLVPRVVSRAWGGALVGFVEVSGALWPVISLAHVAQAPEVVS